MKNGCSLERSSDGGAYLVYCPREGDLLDQTAVGMMEHNRIEGLLPMQRSQLDGVWTLRYPLTGLVPGTELLTGGCQDKRRLLRCLEGVCLAFQSAEEFLLDPSLLCLEPEMIFCSPEDGAARLVYLPLVRQGAPEADLCGFLRQAIQQAQLPPWEDNGCQSELLGLLAQHTFTLERFHSALRRHLQGRPIPRPASGWVGVAPASAQPAAAAVPEAPPPQPIPSAGKKEKKRLFSGLFQNKPPKEPKPGRKAKQKREKPQKAASALPFEVPGAPRPAAPPVQPSSPPPPGPARQEEPVPAGWAAPLEGLSPSVGMVQAEQAPPVEKASQVSLTAAPDFPQETREPGCGRPGTPTLIWLRTGEHLPIDTPDFLIGRSGEGSGCLVADNMAVSLRHLRLFFRDGRLWAVDLGSTNGTLLDGVPLIPQEPVPLSGDCVLTVANETFQIIL